MEQISGIVYTLDENDLIVSEQKMDFSYAVANYMNKRDNKGRRLIVSVEGKDVPYKRKTKKLIDLTTARHKLDNSVESNHFPTDEQP